MSLYKQANSPYWFIDLSPPNGGPRIRRSTGTENKREAQELHDKIKHELWRQVKLGDVPKYTWNEAVKRYIGENYGMRSIEHEKAMIRWLSRFLAGKLVSEITQETVEELISKRLAERSAVRKGVTSNATVNRHMGALSRVLGACRRWGWISGLPPIRKLKEPVGRLRWLSKDEAARLLAALPPHLKAMARFTLACGLRENNVLDLHWSQVDTDRACVWIHADQSKNEAALAIPLNPEALAVLEGQKGRHSDWVFPYNGKPLVKASSQGWYKAMAKAGIEGFTWHGLRHTWASWHVMNGTPLEVLQKLGGWKRFEMVLRYAHLAPGYVGKYADNAKPV